jgi:hypothetical protein
MKRAALLARHRLLPLHLLGALIVLGSGLLGAAAWAAAPASEDSLATAHFTQACSALDAGDLDGAARHLRALREKNPEAPEGRLLESLLTLRREQPSLGWLDAFVRAWNDAGRPDLIDSRIIPPDEPYDYPDTKAAGLLADSPEAEVMLALLMEPSARRGRLILQHLPELEPPELIFAADDTLRNPKLPKALRTQGSRAVRARLSELTVASPQAMQYPALLLVHGTSEDAPFTAEEIQAIEAVAALPDWRETDFHTLYQRALSRFEAAGHPQPIHAAFMLAVSALATHPAYLLYKRTEASREELAPEQLHRLGEALWRIGSRMAAESTLLERLLGLRMMKDGARLVGDETRAAQVEVMREEARVASDAFRQALPGRWPLQGLRMELLDVQMRDEMGVMLRFRPSTPASDKVEK